MLYHLQQHSMMSVTVVQLDYVAINRNNYWKTFIMAVMEKDEDLS